MMPRYRFGRYRGTMSHLASQIQPDHLHKLEKEVWRIVEDSKGMNYGKELLASLCIVAGSFVLHYITQQISHHLPDPEANSLPFSAYFTVGLNETAKFLSSWPLPVYGFLRGVDAASHFYLSSYDAPRALNIIRKRREEWKEYIARREVPERILEQPPI